MSPGAGGGAFDTGELEALFGLIESSPLRRLVARRAREVRLVDHARAHNIGIVLSGEVARSFLKKLGCLCSS